MKLSTACLLSCLLPVIAMAETELIHQPTYETGEKIRMEVEVKTDQSLTINGMNLESGADNFIVTTETIEEASGLKTTRKGQFETFQMLIKLPGGQELQFDAANPDATTAAGPLGQIADFVKTVAAATWTSKTDEDGEIQSVEYDGDLSKIPEAFKGDISPERTKRQVETHLKRFPGKPVSVGDTWQRDETANLGQGQEFQLQRKFTYLGPEERNGKMMEKVAMKTTGVAFDVGSQLPLQVKESDLKVESSEGAYWYDPELKEIVEIQDKNNFVGTMTFVANGNELPAELDLTMEVGTKFQRVAAE